MTDTTATLVPTPNEDSLERRFSDFGTFGEALDYAATRAGSTSTMPAAISPASIRSANCAPMPSPSPAALSPTA